MLTLIPVRRVCCRTKYHLTIKYDSRQITLIPGTAPGIREAGVARRDGCQEATAWGALS